MNDSEQRPDRKIPIHLPARESANRSLIVFVTLCAEKRKPILAHKDAHRLLVDSWRQTDTWIVGRYMVMPNHIHLFCSPGQLEYPPLKKWVQYWKALVSQKWPKPAEQPIWQKSFWDTQLRQGERYTEKWEYVRLNPVRAGLCECPQEWPYQGELNVLQWHD